MASLVFLIIFILDTIQTGSCFDCYSCTYTRSTDPTVDYQCVTSPQNVTVGQLTIACTAPYMCVTKTLFDEDLTHIRSVTRSCQPQQEICAGQKCCNLHGVYKTCEYKCRDELCNNNNPEEHFRSGQISDDDRGGEGGGSANIVMSYIGTLFLTCSIHAIQLLK